MRQDRRRHVSRCVSVEGSPPGDHLVQDTSEREDITSGVSWSSTHLFRLHVESSAEDSSWFRVERDGLISGTRSRCDAGEPEIQDLHNAVFS